jgi:RNA polymerase sigma-70 factor (ECF subfamily)
MPVGVLFGSTPTRNGDNPMQPAFDHKDECMTDRARKESFESLYRSYRPGLLRFITSVTQRPSLAEDVFDDTMLVVWRKARGFDPASAPSRWIFAIAYRLSLKARRKANRELGRVNESIDAASSPAAESEWRHEALGELLRRALVGLSDAQREAVELTCFQGYSCREAARIRRCPVDTVKTRMFYARRKLRTRLGQARDEAM